MALEGVTRRAREEQHWRRGRRFVVCGCTPWARRAFERALPWLAQQGEWLYIGERDALTHEALASYFQPYVKKGPHLVFFLHWRWLVPEAIVRDFACIGFHLGRLPEERGGTPLQWRMLNGQDKTVLSVFRMTSELDAGPVLSDGVEVSLEGSAEAIYARAMHKAAWWAWVLAGMWPKLPEGRSITREELEQHPPRPRRKPEDSRLCAVVDGDGPRAGGGLAEVYDRIRMVDAPGYPRAFLDYGRFRFTFRRAVLYDGRIEADVTITERPGDGHGNGDGNGNGEGDGTR